MSLKTMGQSEENRWRSVLLNVLLVNDKSMPRTATPPFRAPEIYSRFVQFMGVLCNGV